MPITYAKTCATALFASRDMPHSTSGCDDYTGERGSNTYTRGRYRRSLAVRVDVGSSRNLSRLLIEPTVDRRG
jgi:hypothetical protein